MKSLLLIGLLLCACGTAAPEEKIVTSGGKIIVNGKNCEIIRIHTNGFPSVISFVDCNPPAIYNCPAPNPNLDSVEEMKKIQEIKKGFYK